MNALIATPTAGHIVTTSYVQSVVAATLVFHDLGWSYRHSMFDGNDVAYARNYFANLVLQRPELTHLLFIDSDMQVEMPVFRRMIEFDKPIVGTIYTKRGLDWEQYRKLLREGVSDDRAKALASDFNVQLPEGQVQVVNGFCRVKAMGFGCVLIQCSLLERMSEHCATFEMTDAHLARDFSSPRMHDFFSAMESHEAGEFHAEDYWFCRRVLELSDTEIWALADTGIEHVGRYRYSVPFLSGLDKVP